MLVDATKAVADAGEWRLACSLLARLPEPRPLRTYHAVIAACSRANNAKTTVRGVVVCVGGGGCEGQQRGHTAAHALGLAALSLSLPLSLPPRAAARGHRLCSYACFHPLRSPFLSATASSSPNPRSLAHSARWSGADPNPNPDPTYPRFSFSIRCVPRGWNPSVKRTTPSCTRRRVWVTSRLRTRCGGGQVHALLSSPPFPPSPSPLPSVPLLCLTALPSLPLLCLALIHAPPPHPQVLSLMNENGIMLNTVTYVLASRSPGNPLEPFTTTSGGSRPIFPRDLLARPSRAHRSSPS